jgi:uncharacterized UPF0160 family protein
MNITYPPTIVTHSGAFHADELMAIALLERFLLQWPLRVALGWGQEELRALRTGTRPPVPEIVLPSGHVDCRQPVWVVRSRHPDVLQWARAQADVFVLDVGGELDFDNRNLDHHQAGMTLAWPNGTPLSSTGLVWHYLADRGYLSELSPGVQQVLVDELIEPLDAHDNGVRLSPDGTIVEGYNRGGGDGELQLQQFSAALDFCRARLDNALHAAARTAEARDILAAAWAQAKARGERFVLLNDSLPGNDGARLLAEISQGQARLLGLPGQSDRYSLISLPVSPQDRFSVACPMPAPWRGRMDFHADLGQGRSAHLAFAHKTGFMCVVVGGVAQARAVAAYVVAAQDS